LDGIDPPCRRRGRVDPGDRQIFLVSSRSIRAATSRMTRPIAIAVSNGFVQPPTRAAPAFSGHMIRIKAAGDGSR
jgi:hypothetical protein